MLESAVLQNVYLGEEVEEPVFQYVPEKCLSPAWGEVRISPVLWIRNDFDADPDPTSKSFWIRPSRKL
jgi:hypothetical protein